MTSDMVMVVHKTQHKNLAVDQETFSHLGSRPRRPPILTRVYAAMFCPGFSLMPMLDGASAWRPMELASTMIAAGRLSRVEPFRWVGNPPGYFRRVWTRLAG